MYQHTLRLSAALTSISLSALALAAPPAPQQSPITPFQPTPATLAPTASANPASASLTITIIEVHGKARVRPTPDAPWQLAVADLTLDRAALIQTSLKSSVTIRVGETQLLTIGGNSSITVSAALDESSTTQTVVNVSYGRVEFNIDSSRTANNVRIQAPDMTLGVHGTWGGIEHRGSTGTFVFGAVDNRGSFSVDWNSGKRSAFRGSETANASITDPARAEALRTTIDTSQPVARDRDEKRIVQRSTGAGDSILVSTGARAKPPEGTVVQQGLGTTITKKN